MEQGGFGFITDVMIDSFATAGSPERCKQYVGRLVDKGDNTLAVVGYSS